MYKFNFNDKEYELKEDNCLDFYNDEEKPVTGFELEDAIQFLSEGKEVDFESAYYDEACENCFDGERQKTYEFLEYHYYIFTKEGNYVNNSIACKKENISLGSLLRSGEVDNSYIVSFIVCVDCGSYYIEIEDCGV